ncbi:MAG: SusF/SusE family outer membrane protein [Candidatus Cryptobacteroides sp.]
MKAAVKIMALGAATLCLAAACQQESVRIDLPTPEDQMHLSASASDVTINFYDLESEAISFSWEDCGFEASGTPYNTYFKMEIADNDYATSIDKITVTGRNSISFNGQQLSVFLNGWEIPNGNKVSIEAEVIAEPVVEDIETQKYRKPEVSKVRFSAVFVAPSEIHLTGEELDVEFKTDDDFFILKPGTYSFTSAGHPFMSFEVSEGGLWYVRPDYAESTVVCVRPQAWIVGSACLYGWDLGKMEELKSVNESGSVRRYKGILSTSGDEAPGELKIALRKNGLFEIPFLRPQADRTPVGEGEMVLWKFGEGEGDDKWIVNRTALYTITVDYENMKIDFEKSEVDLPWYKIWMVGDATPEGWQAYPFPIKLRYDGENEKDGVFVYEGYLQTGEFKFPLQESDWYSPYLMPKNVDGDNHGAFPEDGGVSEVTFIDAGGPDQKWYVNTDQSGDYILYLNVLDMTLTVKKK